MSKPTLVQKALNRPSQTYVNIDAHQTQKKDYYSTKQDMLRIAAAAATSIDTRERNTIQMQSQTSATLARTLYYPSNRLHQQYVRQGEGGDDDYDDGDGEGDSDLEVFFTPNTSPRTSMASSVATITFPGGATRKSSRRSLTNVTSGESHQPMLLPLPEQSASTAKAEVKTPTQAQVQMNSAVPSTRTPSTSSISKSSSSRSRHPALASSSSLSSATLDGHSVFSSEAGETTLYQGDRNVDRNATSTPKAKDKNREKERSSRSGNGTATIIVNPPTRGTSPAAGTANTTGRSQPRVQSSSRSKSPAGGNGSASGKGDHKPPTSTPASPSTVTPAGPSHGSATTTIVIGSSRDHKGKEREKEREGEKEKERERERKSTQSNSQSHSASVTSASTSTRNPSSSASPSTSTPKPSASTSTSTPNPSTKSSSAFDGTGTISISSRTKYVHPTSTTTTSSGSSPSTKTPHTFSAFAAIGSSSSSNSGLGSNAMATATPTSASPSTTTPATSSSGTTVTPPHSLSRKGHRQITSSSANGAATFSTTTPKTSSPLSSSSSPSTSNGTSTKPSTPKISPPSKILPSSKISSASKTPAQSSTANANGYGDPALGGNGRDKSRSSSSTSSTLGNGNAKHISSSTPLPSSSSSPSASASPLPASLSPQNQDQNQSPKQQQQTQHSQQHRKPPPPVLAPLPIQIQNPGSGMMTIFGMDALLEEEEGEEEEEGIYGEEYEDEEDDDDEEEEQEDNGRSTPRMYDRGQVHSTRPSTQASGSGSVHSRRPPPKTLSAEVTSLQQTFTTPGERPSKGTQGYTSLVLPRAPDTQVNGHARMQVKASKDASSGKVDLTKSGVAQTTMASVEVVRGLGERARGKGVLGLFRLGRMGRERRERPRGPLPVHIPGAGAGLVSDSAANGDGNAATLVHPAFVNPNANVTPLGFTAYRAPPGHVPSGSVLVQVWAVGVDGVDGRLVGVRFGYENAASYVEGGAGGNGHDTEDDAERTGGETEGEETETETEREEVPNTEDEDEEDEGNILSTQSTPARPTQAQVSPGKKGGLAALGRSFSLRLKKGGGEGDGKAGVQRSASASVGGAKTNMKFSTDANHANPNDSPAPKRALSFSLKRSNTAASRVTNGTTGSSSTQHKSTSEGKTRPKPKTKSKGRKKTKLPKQPQASVGYIPGRSFVGRVLECGWEVRDEVVRKGEWVVGLLDVRKGGALAEFIVVDRHRVHRVPQPQGGTASHPLWAMSPTAPSSPGPPSHRSSSSNAKSKPPPTLTLEELALLPLCGLPAYRAVRTLMYAFSSNRDGSLSGTTSVDRRGLDFVGGNYAHGHKPASNPNATMIADHTDRGQQRRALVLRGHDGVGAMAVQMLARWGWLVSVHVPCSALPYDASQDMVDRFMQVTEERARAWGADEIIHDDSPQGGVPALSLNANGEVDGPGLGLGGDDGGGAAVRLMDMIREDGDVFDAVFDTVGGKEVREAGERLLRSMGAVGVTRNGLPVNRRRGMGQFTTVVGDVPERVVPTAGDNFRAGLRSLRLGGAANANNNHGHVSHPADGDEGKGASSSGAGKVGYAWVSVAQDVDWEGDDVSETLGTVVRLALEGGIRPVVEDIELSAEVPMSRVVPFEQAPRVFVDNGPLRDGGTVVVKIAE